jgi:hypothetical protein
VGRNNNFNFHCGVLVDLQFVWYCGHAKIALQQEQAASSSHRGTSTPLAPQPPLFLHISPFAEILKKEDRFFARGMGHWTKRRLKEGDRFGN